MMILGSNESDSWPIGKTIPTFIFHNSYQNNHTQIKDNTIIGSLTYVQGLTDKVKGVIANNNYTKIGLKTNNTAEKNIYTNTKDKIKKLNNTNVIYEVQCQGCDSKYIGETKNKLLERLQHHKNNIKNRSNTTALSQHSVRTKHEFKFENTKILEKEENHFKRKFIESAYILLNNPCSINFKTDTQNINNKYNNILNTIKK